MPENTFATNSFYEVLSTKYSEFLKRDEVYEIIIQFRRLPLWPGHQVMWSGVPRDWVQSWADERGMQTLSSALGPLMDGKSRVCRRRHKTTEEWSLYVAGASALFAECLPKGHVVTLVTRPPPQRLHPLGSTTYQLLELPALKRDIYGLSASRIDVVHITVRGAENYAYQFWPIDEKHHWIESFSYCLIRKHLGRKDAFEAPNKTESRRPREKKSTDELLGMSTLWLFTGCSTLHGSSYPWISLAFYLRQGHISDNEGGKARDRLAGNRQKKQQERRDATKKSVQKTVKKQVLEVKQTQTAESRKRKKEKRKRTKKRKQGNTSSRLQPIEER